MHLKLKFWVLAFYTSLSVKLEVSLTDKALSMCLHIKTNHRLFMVSLILLILHILLESVQNFVAVILY